MIYIDNGVYSDSKNDYLCHHGVKGMKWGVRHDREKTGLTRSKKPKYDPNLTISQLRKEKRKGRKLPRTSIGLALKYRNMTEQDYQDAKRDIERDREVLTGVTKDLENFNKIVDYIPDRINKAAKAYQSIQTLTGRDNRNTPDIYYDRDYNRGWRFAHSDIPTLSHSDMNDIDNFLCHFGVLGMKWGVRKAKERYSGKKRSKKINRDKYQIKNKSTSGYKGKSSKVTSSNNGWTQERFDELNKNYTKQTGESLGKLEYYDDTDLLNLLEQDYSKREKNPSMHHSDTIAIPSLQHDDMNDIDNFLCHYGVLGMKWGVHKARQHEKNLYLYDRYYNGTGKKAAKAKYKARMAKIKETAKANKHNKAFRVKDIENPSLEEARSKIADYDKKRKDQKSRRRTTAVAAGLTAALAARAAYGHFNKGAVGSRKIASGEYKIDTGNKRHDQYIVNAHKDATYENNLKTTDKVVDAALGGLVTGSLALGSRVSNKKDFGSDAKLTREEQKHRRYGYMS